MTTRFVNFKVPEGMSSSQLAKTFNAYLLGDLALDNKKDEYGIYNYGPYTELLDAGDIWRLECNNNYWLAVYGDTAKITCRYDSQMGIIIAAVNLFNAVNNIS